MNKIKRLLSEHPILCFFISCILSFLFLIPWFVFVPRAVLLWIFIFIITVIDAKRRHREMGRNEVSGLSKTLRVIYGLLVLILLTGATYFFVQLHPVIVAFLWLIALFGCTFKRAHAIIILQILHLSFMFLLVFDGAVAPHFQTLQQNSGVKIVSAPGGSVRNIFTDEKEENLYFTAYSKGARRGAAYETFFRLRLKGRNKSLNSLVYSFCYSGAYDKKRDLLYLLGRDKGELLVVSPKTMRILRKVKILRDPADIYMDEKRDEIIILFEWNIAAYDPDTLQRISSCSNKHKANFVQGIISSESDKFYVACFTFGGVQERNLKTCRITRQIPFQMTPWAIAADSEGKSLYFTDFLLGTLSVVDVKSFKIIKSVHIKSGVRAVEVDEKRGLIYVGNFLSPYLVILDNNLQILEKVFVGNPCRDIKLLKNGRLFVASNLGLLEVDVDEVMKH